MNGFRRNAVAAIIQLANKHVSGGWALVSVIENEYSTSIVFECDYPYTAPDGNQYKRLFVTVATISEPEKQQ